MPISFHQLQPTLYSVQTTSCQSSCPPVSHPPLPHLPPPSYTSQPSISNNDRVTIVLKCPNISSLHWCLSLYSLVLGGIGMIFSTLWVVGHGYVLSQTNEGGLRVQRWTHIAYFLALNQKNQSCHTKLLAQTCQCESNVTIQMFWHLGGSFSLPLLPLPTGWSQKFEDSWHRVVLSTQLWCAGHLLGVGGLP